MRIGKQTTVLVMVIGCWSSGAQAQEALDAVEKKVADAWAQVKSLTAKAKTDSNFENQPVKSFGTIEYMNDGGRELVRLETTLQRIFPDRTAEAKTMMLYDGTYLYTVTDHGGSKVAAKQLPNNLNIAPGGRRFFQLLKKNNALRVLPDEKLDGKDAYVIEARPFSPTPQTANLMKFYLSKETGLRLKAVGVAADGKEVFLSDYSEISLNGPTSAERYKFEPAPDVDVMDATKPAPLVAP